MRTLVSYVLLPFVGFNLASATSGLNFSYIDYSKSDIPFFGRASSNFAKERYEIRSGTNSVGQITSQEDLMFDKLNLIMTPVIAYFNENNPEFSIWYSSASLIMEESTKKKIVQAIYLEQLGKDEKLKTFWEKIKGNRLEVLMFDVKGTSLRLKNLLDLETNTDARAHEFRDLEKKSIEDHVEFFGTSNVILDSISLGTLNKNNEMYAEAIRAFLDASVAFKALKHRVVSKV